MTQPPEDLTQPIPSDSTQEQPAVDVPAVDAAAPVEPPTPAWANAAHEGDTAASARPVPVVGPNPVPVAVPVATAAGSRKASWRSRVSGGRGLAVGALVVGLGLGAVAGSAVTWAVGHHDQVTGTTADGNARFDRDGGRFGPPGGRGGMPPGGGQLPNGDQQGGDQQGGTGQLPGGGTGTGGSTGSTGSDSNGTAQTT